MPLCHFSGYNLWLLKPTKLNRGRGIHVVNNLTYLRQLLVQYCGGKQLALGQGANNTVTSQTNLAAATDGNKSDISPPRTKDSKNKIAGNSANRNHDHIDASDKKQSSKKRATKQGNSSHNLTGSNNQIAQAN